MSRSNLGRAKYFLILLPILALILIVPSKSQDKSTLAPYLDPSLSFEQRVNDLVSRMTLEEKVSQMVNDAPAIERLGIPPYNWWSECLHGVARAGIATVFPQAIGLAATWDTDLQFQVATVTSDEARAKHHEAVRQHNYGQNYGLTFWSPNINIFRDPRWGRGQETYGEDPYLTARIGVAFVKGLQGDDPKYLKVVATPKHYAVHSGPESERHQFDARVEERDLRETYLPAFEACVREGKAFSVMGAYNRTNGEACCAHHKLLQQILRGEWGFGGYVVSDCGAIGDIFKGHHLVGSIEEASSLAVKQGCDLDCLDEYKSLVKAVHDGLIKESEIDVAVKRLFEARFRLGMFDPPDRVAYARIPYSVNDNARHRELALKTARESMVLLKNEKDLLPLKKDLKTLAVIGPNSDVVSVLLGNYNGTPSKAVTPLEGIRNKVGAHTQVLYARGCDWARPAAGTQDLDEAVKAAKSADAVVMFLGLSPELEGEEMEVKVEGFKGGDRLTLDLPKVQEKLLQAVQATGKPVVLVLLSGSALAVNWADQYVGAILEAWYPGEEAGTAIADVLFGDYNPAGRLPVTFYKSVDQLPPFEDYAMAGRTYRYFKGEPLYPFGHGLSYTQFKYGKLALKSGRIQPNEEVKVSVEVTNSGGKAGDEVVQLYVSRLNASVPVPIRSLQGFKRIQLAPGETRKVEFTLTPRQFSVIDNNGKRVVEPGKIRVDVGGKQPGFKGTADTFTTQVVSAQYELVGDVTPVE